MRKLIAPLVAAGLLASGILLSLAGPAPANDAPGCPTGTTGATGQTGSTDATGPPPRPLNEVVIENCQGGTTLTGSKLQVGRVDTSPAQPTNVAIAYSHDCATACESIAAAFQVVLVELGPGANVQTPQNAAVAVNQNCTGCGAFAYAHQYALDVPPGTTLSAGTRRQIAQLRREAADDVHSADVRTFNRASQLDGQLREVAADLDAAVNAGLQHEHVHATHPHSSEHTKESGQES